MLPKARIVEVAWTLSFEMFFYLVTAACVLGLRIGQWPQGRRVTLSLLLTGGFLAAALVGYLQDHSRMLPIFAGMLLAQGLGTRVPAWAGWEAPVFAFAATALPAGSNRKISADPGLLLLVCRLFPGYRRRIGRNDCGIAAMTW